METLNSAVIIGLLALLTMVIVFVFWKKTNMFTITPVITLPLYLMSLLSLLMSGHSSPCNVYHYSLTYTVLNLLFEVFATAISLSSLVFILTGVFMWIKFRKDKQKSRSAKNRIFAGLITLGLIFVIFILVNVVNTAFGIGASPLSLCVPNLSEFGQ